MLAAFERFAGDKKNMKQHQTRGFLSIFHFDILTVTVEQNRCYSVS